MSYIIYSVYLESLQADWGAEGEDYSEQQWGTEEYQQVRYLF